MEYNPDKKNEGYLVNWGWLRGRYQWGKWSHAPPHISVPFFGIRVQPFFIGLFRALIRFFGVFIFQWSVSSTNAAVYNKLFVSEQFAAVLGSRNCLGVMGPSHQMSLLLGFGRCERETENGSGRLSGQLYNKVFYIWIIPHLLTFWVNTTVHLLFIQLFFFYISLYIFVKILPNLLKGLTYVFFHIFIIQITFEFG